MNLDLHEVLNKEVTRREFLAHIGVSVLAMIGITGMLKHIGESFGSKKSRTVTSSDMTYGSSAYSGSDLKLGK